IYPPVKNFALLNDLNARVMSTLGGYSSGREVIYAAGIAMIKDNPVTGVGIGGVEKNYSDYVRRVEWAPEERKKMVYGHLHNLYLQIYAETGFAGFASFICLCLYVLAGRLIKKIKSIKEEGTVEKAFAAGTALAFAAVLVMGLSEYNMFNNEISRILWFYTGMALGERKN
ncbi:MAG TPA: O-antigen ligase family protein, partial [Candidatus Wallbacteria bacterium]|nr:O-antigen ligase family protein [Candidatus Wallbacteria bacterium]